MKKIYLGTFLILATNTSVFAALPSNIPPCVVGAPCYRGGVTFGFDIMLWQSSIVGLDYALFFPQFDSTNDNAPIFDQGVFKIIEPGEDEGLKINIGYIFPCSSNDVLLTGTFYGNFDEERFVNPTVGFNLFGLFSSSLLGPNPETGIIPATNELSFFDPSFNFNDIGTVTNLVLPIPVQTASARFRLNLQKWDLDFGQYFSIGRPCRIRLFTGVQTTDLKIKFESRYQGVSRNINDIVVPISGNPGIATFNASANLQVTQKSHYGGAGPKAGININYHLGNGFGLVAEGTVAGLIGDISADLEEELSYVVNGLGRTGAVAGVAFTDNTQRRIIQEKIRDHIRFVPSSHAKLALNYTYEVCYLFWTRVTAELGYEVLHYWNDIDFITRTDERRPERPEVATLFNPADVIVSEIPTTPTQYTTTDTGFSGFYFNLQIQL